LPSLCVAIALLVVCRGRRPSECHANYKVVWNGMEVDFAHKIGCHGNILRGIEKNNFRSFLCGQSSTNFAHFVKIGAVNVEKIVLTEITTRNSAIAEGPRDASYQLKSCQLPHNSAETTCTTSSEQIEVIKMEVYSGPMCNKHVHSTMTRSSRFHCPVCVINKPTTGELWISPVHRRVAVAKVSKSTM